MRRFPEYMLIVGTVTKIRWKSLGRAISGLSALMLMASDWFLFGSLIDIIMHSTDTEMGQIISNDPFIHLFTYFADTQPSHTKEKLLLEYTSCIQMLLKRHGLMIKTN